MRPFCEPPSPQAWYEVGCSPLYSPSPSPQRSLSGPLTGTVLIAACSYRGCRERRLKLSAVCMEADEAVRAIDERLPCVRLDEPCTRRTRRPRIRRPGGHLVELRLSCQMPRRHSLIMFNRRATARAWQGG